MRKEKYYMALNDSENQLLLRCLNKLRTQQINSGKDSEPVDEMLIKIIKVKKRKFKIIEREA